MDTINKLDDIINQKAEEKLNKRIEVMRFCDVDLMNTHIEIPENFGYISDSSETKGKRFVRADDIIPLIQKAIYKKDIKRVREEERTNFLNDLQMLKDYLNS